MPLALTQQRLILASRSPRRSYLLRKAGLDITVEPSGVDESRMPVTDPPSYARALATAKALDVSGRHPDAWVIGADTIVVAGDAILGKPEGPSQARQMLERLSGRTHRVITGYCICCKARNLVHADAVVTRVLFKALSAAEIDWYIGSGEPFDKAGAYAIQGIGTFLVRSIEGSYTNVVGLPVCEVLEFLIREKALCFSPTQQRPGRP